MRFLEKFGRAHPEIRPYQAEIKISIQSLGRGEPRVRILPSWSHPDLEIDPSWSLLGLSTSKNSNSTTATKPSSTARISKTVKSTSNSKIKKTINGKGSAREAAAYQKRWGSTPVSSKYSKKNLNTNSIFSKENADEYFRYVFDFFEF